MESNFLWDTYAPQQPATLSSGYNFMEMSVQRKGITWNGILSEDLPR